MCRQGSTGLAAAYPDQRQVEVADLREQAVQRRQVGGRPGDDGLAARAREFGLLR
jgi:hypothetical protein